MTRKFIPICTDKRNSKCYEMFVTANLHSLGLNSLAVAEMINIFGGHNYSIELQVSEDGKAVGFKPVESERNKINPQKSITSRPVWHIIKSHFKNKLGGKRFPLKREGDMLVFELSD